MNFQNLNFDFVEAPRQGPPKRQTPGQQPVDDDDQSSQPILHPYYDLRQRVGRNSTNPSASPPGALFFAPSPPSLPPSKVTASTAEIYGPERLFGSDLPGGFAAPTPPTQTHNTAPPVAPPAAPTAPTAPTPGSVRFDEAQLAMFAAENAARMASIKDELTIAAGKVTPGVDDTPYIQYALEALTRNHGGPSAAHFPSGSSNDYEEDYPQPRRYADEDMARGYPQLTQPEPAYVEDRLPEPIETQAPRHEMPDTSVHPAPNARHHNEPVAHHDVPAVPRSPTPSDHSEPDQFAQREKARPRSIPIDRAHPPLVFKPAILRPVFMCIFALLCLLMIAALIFCAVYSQNHGGFTPYPGSIYSGQYFLFRILPQIFAGIILIYAQSIITASIRTIPFTAMADAEPRERYLALFRRLRPMTFLIPSFTGPWQFQCFSVCTWLANFTIPLMSTAFTCIFKDQGWVWAAVQGVAWTLVTLYILLLAATIALMMFWRNRWTGLLWDIRSVGHLLPLLSQSNTTSSYNSPEAIQSNDVRQDQLRQRALDRLGYWQMDGQQGGVWYGIGSVGDGGHSDYRTYDLVLKKPEISPASSLDDLEAEVRHYKYTPIALRTSVILGSVILMTLLILAIVIVSFLPQTRLDQGYFPQVPARPRSGAFSAANFLYAFIPSLLGMIMFLLFQSLDDALRTHQPWADMSKSSGEIASKSILADYAACYPFQCTWKALRNGHWRVAVISFMATIFIFIPVLAGGLFMALTNFRGQVKMFPNMPVFGVLLAFLFLYLGCLSLMLPGRRALRIPHSVDNLAEIISLTAARETLSDPAFLAVRDTTDLKARLGLDRSDPREQSMWYFGGSRDERYDSVRPMKRFTEKRMRSHRST
ncbi:uncharacterized protein FFB20_02603 [Fusarium fujikuroi]|uniref:Phosphoribosylaminoimidazole-succinocarboxamide synthase n=2 Tax=Fusarium fujikuroi TaxID=5127 RepID=S0E861_GIBF5|nr:uncharacterized protein FFUJ_05907 [Fusarium fujikuroi IMI 58289]KLP09642.1 uncharacterized protein Y057_5156 [Fusarium fujikuroi]QGI65819.1 hypothetical protein CEK27_009790 [Fusarium fujikuroi]QGI83060.1 hypothetical protein CEK25_009789 [Fusarium fujikuroi]QGI96700.1 hypothetical protein CEK26_009769 [Fusarium fujikuroi]CCT69977.1 uncharacterized protein FFUJ_05907 [Fusarium fujikuroi IMI 58289]